MAATDEAITCGLIPGRGDDYNISLHVGAIFIVLAFSLAGSLLPVVSKHCSCLKQMNFIMEFVNAFGVGVVISTALVHMLPPANEALNNPCLNMPYRGLANVIVVVAVLLMQWLQTELLVRYSSVLDTTQSTDPSLVETQLEPSTINTAFHSHGHGPGKPSSSSGRKISIVIFEFGVAIHSIIIGVNLGVASGTTFTTLLTAISFHQFFEGAAVGSSALLAFESLKATLWSIVGFVSTTPIGVGIGIGIAQSYSSTSATSLWVQGCLDAVAAGILLYTGIVELLSNQYTNNSDFRAKATKTRIMTYVFVAAGACSMSIVGYWT